ncbi:MAG: hypothetical protein L3J69_10020 [Desulfobacula sp.]|nr:hypothetical protein [Desulfobacula sp.]
MRHLVVKTASIVSLSIFLITGIGFAADLNILFKQVEKLNLERQGYVLGAKLNKDQLKTAKANPEKAAAADTFKFRDKNLFVVAHNGSNRIVLLYELFKDADQQQVKDLVGDLYMNFEDPTVMAHDKIIYWAWAKKGKISSLEFDNAKDDKTNKTKLGILATVKCVSDIEIMAKQKEASTGDVYYVITSDPILTFFADRNS